MRSAALTDAASLERWSVEHRDVNAAGLALGRAGDALRDGDGRALAEVRHLAFELADLLRPHLLGEEELINADRLREMISSRAVAELARRSRHVARDPARMAAFYAHSLSPDELSHIVDLQVAELGKRLAVRRITVEVTPAAHHWLSLTGYDPAYGARPLRRLVQTAIGDPLARMLLAGEVSDGDTVLVDVAENEADGLVLTVK